MIKEAFVLLDPISTVLVLPAMAFRLATARPEYERYAENYERTPSINRSDTEHVRVERAPTATEIRLLLPTPPPAQGKQEILHRLIAQFADLPDGWNGEGSVAPSASAVAAARTFLESIPRGIPLPTPMLTEGGDMEFYWSLPTGYADISFDANGVGSLFARSTAGEEFFFENLAPQFGQLPDQQRLMGILAPHWLAIAA
ncbi:MAG: hypothetical protein V5B60_13580 [Accumulibacter sp.]|uniref:hypothetical protein n=1 Tax=Accumulibacter sp. TaxID=2053492 RepID=UPI002FC3B052